MNCAFMQRDIIQEETVAVHFHHLMRSPIPGLQKTNIKRRVKSIQRTFSLDGNIQLLELPVSCFFGLEDNFCHVLRSSSVV